MKKLILLILSTMVLDGCTVLNSQTEPNVLENCDYANSPGKEFIFKQLDQSQILNGYSRIYVAQSRESATLSNQYQGRKGKLTGEVVERYYRQNNIWRFNQFGAFRDDFYDDEYYTMLYLTPKQRIERLRNSYYVFQQALLENCQVVYISVDSLALHPENPQLIEQADLKFIE